MRLVGGCDFSICISFLRAYRMHIEDALSRDIHVVPLAVVTEAKSIVDLADACGFKVQMCTTFCSETKK